ncbi:MAG: hypothetical protein JWL94_496 [Microbacteriaceae bacterium]|jgi:hypothetical protein|nr:hypothetical protein [Microbacteriaceae bacterium]
MILALIIAGEIGFWVAIVGGLAARYLLRAKRLGAALLVCAPLIDVVLLVAVVAHLSSGAAASWHHGLAALYIGFSLAYGHRMIVWADTRFAQRFADGPAPTKLTGWSYTKKCWGDVLRTLGAIAVASGILALITWWVNDLSRTEALTQWYRVLGIVLAIDFIWALSYTIFPRKPAEAPSVTHKVAGAPT